MTATITDELARAIRDAAKYGECHEEVTRRGESEPCDRTAVALRYDPTFGGPYPVCARHARGHMVLLADVVAAVERTLPDGTERLYDLSPVSDAHTERTQP